ncbi:MAG: hypothetical protein IJU40_02495, partial [Desulfovibrionaceae bacterium]|nr:hypothetical protein [Desulfovibrionaceae bacterium]
GCAFYIFRSDDVFASISKKQYEFYDMICAKAFDNGFNAEILPQLIEACTVTELDRSTLYITLIKILLGYIVEKNEILSTIEAAEKVKNKVAELIKGGRPREAILGEATITYHTRVRGIENLAALIMGLQFKLSEYDKGCEYYWDTCEKFDINTRKNEDGKSKDMEIVFYCLLDHLYYLTKDNNLWIEFYEKYVSYVTPRDSLVEKYNALKNATT